MERQAATGDKNVEFDVRAVKSKLKIANTKADSADLIKSKVHGRSEVG